MEEISIQRKENDEALEKKFLEAQAKLLSVLNNDNLKLRSRKNLGKLSQFTRNGTFSNIDTYYDLYQISSLLNLKFPEIEKLLDRIPGFEKIYKSGTEKVVGYKLKEPELARVYIENLSR